MLSQKLTRIISSAASYAARIGSPNTGLTHILLAMVDESEIQRELRARGIDHADVRECLLGFQDSRTPSPPSDGTMTLSPLVVLVMERALTKDVAVEAEGLLAEMWDVEYDGQDDYYATSLLRKLRDGAQDGFTAAPSAAAAPPPAKVAGRAIPENLSKYCTDLVAEAERGAIDPVIGRDGHIGRVCEILARRKKNNPILIGEPGVGKTAIVEGLALKIAEGRVGPALDGARIMSLDVARLIDGARYRGDFEGRLNGIVAELAENPGFILFVDEIHTLVGGASGAADAANLLKPALASGRIRCIGATTHGEHAKYFDADPAMSRRFQPVMVQPPTRDEAVDILTKLLPTYEGHHRVVYRRGTVEAAVDLSMRYVLDRQLPDKAIDVIDEAGSMASARGLGEVTKSTVHETVSRMSGVETDPAGGAAFGERLSLAVKGQHAACQAITRAIARSLSGLGREDRARCSMLFTGPDGSGKRFAAGAVARVLGQPFIRLDMSEFTEAHSVSRLIGPPPGYIGFGAGGQLTEPVRRSPTCVLLLDRIDLAHPHVAAVVIQAVETGRLTDTSGRTASFAGATVIMTAAEANASSGIGFLKAQAEVGDLAGSVARDISEAADALVRFVPIDGAALEEVAKGKMDGLSERLSSLGIKLVSEAAVPAAIAAAAAAAAGAGGMAVERAFRRMVEDTVLDIRASDGQEVALSCENGKVVVRVLDRTAAGA